MRQLSLDLHRSNHLQEAASLRNFGRRWTLSQPVWSNFTRLSIVRALLNDCTPVAGDGASDRELQQMTGPLARLGPEDVRWDLINASASGHRYRI